MLLFPENAVCVTTVDDRWLIGALQRIFIALCDLGVAFFPDSFFFLFSQVLKSCEFYSDTVLSTRVVNISPAHKRTKQYVL